MSPEQHSTNWELHLFLHQEHPSPFLAHLLALLQAPVCLALICHIYVLGVGSEVPEEQCLDESTTPSQNGSQRGPLARSAERRCLTRLLPPLLPVQKQSQCR